MDINTRKQFAVAILAHVWAGGELPPEMVAYAEAIRAEMRSSGTWESA